MFNVALACAQWNIERGYKVDKIIAELLRLNPDIVALQEIDVGNDRSGGRDTGLATRDFHAS